MPKLQEFDAGNVAVRPTETGVEATALTARRVGTFASQYASAEDQLARSTEKLGSETESLGAMKGTLIAGTGARIGSALDAVGTAGEKIAAHMEVSSGSKSFATRLQDLTAQWNDTAKNADPNDPTVAAKFLDQVVKPSLDEFKSGFSTETAQAWAEAHADAFQQHMANKTSADMSTMAGVAVQQNARQTVNSLSNTVRGDPSSMDFALATIKSTTEGLIGTSPNLTPAESARVRSELTQQGAESIIKSAALGQIEKTGEVPTWTSDPKYSPYINGAELKQLAQAAKYYNRLSASEDRAARAQRDYDNKNDFNQKINALETATMPKNVGDDPQLPNDYWDKLRELGTHPGAALEPGRLAAMTNKGEIITARLNKPEPDARVSRETYMELTKKVNGIDGPRLADDSEIYKASEKLTVADFNRLRGEFAAAKTPEGDAMGRARGDFFKRYAPVIDGGLSNGVHSAAGSQRMYEAELDARRQEGVLRAKGLDPHLVYDPRSEYFFGKPENLRGYQVPLSEAMKEAKGSSAPPILAPVTRALPPLAEREDGQVYPTASGPKRWNAKGKGWTNP